MNSDKSYAEIILPLALRQTFTYRVPPGLAGSISSGKRVTVQFGKRKIYTGIVYRLHNQDPEIEGLKNIDSVLDDYPIVTRLQMEFWEWLSEYYMCTKGEVLKAALPSGLKLESESRLYCNPGFQPEEVSLSDREIRLLNYLQGTDGRVIGEIERGSGLRGVHSLLPRMLQIQAVFVEEKLKESYVPVKQIYYCISPQIKEKTEDEITGLLRRRPKQLETLKWMLAVAKEGMEDIPHKDMLEKFSSSVVNALTDSSFILKKEISTLRSSEYEGTLRKPFGLNGFQDEALGKIEKEFKNKDVVLLHGVTSSGKTEIYIKLIDRIISEGRQVLYLLPEIALTSQIVSRLKEVFGTMVGVFHSKFSDSERVDVYRSLLQGEESEYRLILGVRSAIFLPFRNLGLIIVDEEHENTFKQHDPAPRYHARDAAIVLAGLFGAKVVLGTATPSFESYWNAKQGKYGYVELGQRFGGVLLPEIRVADLRKARLKKEMHSVFTPLLVKHITETLSKGKQVILFQNRRGYSSYFQCEDCGEIPRCRLCDVSLTYHKFDNRLVCHYCGYSERIPANCNSCHSTRLTSKGFGTELVEDEIELLFPGARIARLDLDTTRSRKSYEKILGSFGSGKTDILVGTQMLSKGLDFDNVALVGILNADQMLNFPDFRAFERSFQLMSQVSGRAGRKDERGLVVIQSGEPEHPVISYVIHNDFHSFYKNISEERQVFRYPPFVKMIRISVKSKEFNDGKNFAIQLGEKLRKTFGDRVLGPQVPFVGRIKNYYIQQIILKIERSASFKKARDLLREILDDLSREEETNRVRVNVDVDPY